MGERVAVLETEMAETRRALDGFTAATHGFTAALNALNETLRSDAKSTNGNLRRDAVLVLAGATVSGGGVTALLKILG